MLSILMYEDVVTRGDIGRGMGGFLGRAAGGLAGAALGIPGGPLGILSGMGVGAALGGQTGRFIGGKTISDPDKAADFTKASHRVGYLANPVTTWGAATDLVNPNLTGAVNIYNAVSDNGARRLGYQTGGRVGTLFFGPLSGIVAPYKIAANR